MDDGDDAPVTQIGAPGFKRKPRGKPFAKGNTVGPRFEKGVSGNPAGRPPMPVEHIAAMDKLEPLAYQALADILEDPLHKDRAHVAEYIVNRRHGKPIERKEHSGPDGKPISVRTDEGMTTEEMRRELALLMGDKPADETPGEAGEGDPDPPDDEP